MAIPRDTPDRQVFVVHEKWTHDEDSDRIWPRSFNTVTELLVAIHEAMSDINKVPYNCVVDTLECGDTVVRVHSRTRDIYLFASLVSVAT